MILNANLKRYFKGFVYPAEIIMCAVYKKCRFGLSYRDIEELFSMRGLQIDHATLARWVLRFVGILEMQFRKRKKQVHHSWRMDETYIKVKGRWYYLYRAVDKYGATVDFLLKENRDKQAAKAFFRKAMKDNGDPSVVNIDKSGSNTYALADINKERGENNQIKIRQSKYLNNIIEQDHRPSKKAMYVALGFKSFEGAAATLSGVEVVRMIKKNQLSCFETQQTSYQKFCSLVA